MWSKGTNVEIACCDSIEVFTKEVFRTDPWRRNIGNKGIEVIRFGDNEPDQLYIRLHKLGGREPWCMGFDKNTKFHEHQLNFMLDVRVPETEQKAPDNRGPQIRVTSESRKGFGLGTNGELASNVCHALRTVFELDEWREKLSALGVHNCTLKDERETYQGTEYQNPMRLTFETYVFI